MRKPIVIANWKMNKILDEALAFMEEFKLKIPRGSAAKVDVVICPAFVHLAHLAADKTMSRGVSIGAQDAHWEAKGAFTGCVSPQMLKDLRVRYAILGHSERRRYFGESNDMLSGKLNMAVRAGLVPIFCVGEQLKDREANRTFKVLEEQMEVLRLTGQGDAQPDGSDFILAYEPVWAIGTGKNATAKETEEVHDYLRNLLGRLWTHQRAQDTRIVYGGSITPENFASIMSCPNVDGGLVGGSSLEVDKFLKLVEIAGK